jgi:CRISPR-associated protein Cas8b1/Cst1 subtype I-B
VLQDERLSELKLLNPFEIKVYMPFKELAKEGDIQQLFVKLVKAAIYEFYKNSLVKLGLSEDKTRAILGELFDIEMPKAIKENSSIFEIAPGLSNSKFKQMF